jgi:FkbM family methyltransferase
MTSTPPIRERRLGGRTIRIADDKPTFWDRVEAGTWEPGTLAALAPRLGPDATFLDIGAWVGPLTLLAASSGARVMAVEADPSAQDQLRRNLATNPDLAARVEVIAAAIAPSPGEVRLGARRKAGDSMSSVLLADSTESWTARAVTPAMLAERLGEVVRLVVKIDIEGAEYDLLPHIGPLLANQDTVVLVSFHPVILGQAGIRDVETRLAAALVPFAGWRAIAVDGEVGSGPVPDVLLADPTIETWLLSRS